MKNTSLKKTCQPTGSLQLLECRPTGFPGCCCSLHHYPILWSSFLTCCSTSCIWLISLDIRGAESMSSISMATAESPPCPNPLATLDLCNTEPDNEDGGRLSTAAPCENCSLLSFCCFRFYMNKREQ